MPLSRRTGGRLLLGFLLAGLAGTAIYGVRVREAAGGEPGSVPTLAERAFPRGGGPFAVSVGLAVSAAALAAVLALPVGVQLGRRAGAALTALVLVPMVIPPQVAAYTWRFILEDMADLAAPGMAPWRGPAWRFAGVAWTLASLYWPVIALWMGVGLGLRGRRLEEELATLAPPGAVFRRAVLPGVAPAFCAGAGVVFLLSLSNYGVPLMWNVPAQSVAVFARLAAFYEPIEAVALSIPLVSAALVLSLVGLAWLSRAGPAGYGLDLSEALAGAGSAVPPRRGSWAGLATGLVLALTVGLPICALVALPGLKETLRADLLAGWAPYRWGLATAGLGATGATALGTLLSTALGKAGGRRAHRRRRRAARLLVELVGLSALFVPAAVLCALLAGGLNRPGWRGALYDSLAVFPLAYGLRFFYIPFRAMRFARELEGEEQGEAARLMGLGPLRRLRLAVGGPRRAALCVAWLVVFALVLGELEMAAFLAQPGRQPVSVFLDNLMHYGRSGAVAKWSLIVVATEVAAAWVLAALGLAQWRKLRAVR